MTEVQTTESMSSPADEIARLQEEIHQLKTTVVEMAADACREREEAERLRQLLETAHSELLHASEQLGRHIDELTSAA